MKIGQILYKYNGLNGIMHYTVVSLIESGEGQCGVIAQCHNCQHVRPCEVALERRGDLWHYVKMWGECNDGEHECWHTDYSDYDAYYEVLNECRLAVNEMRLKVVNDEIDEINASLSQRLERREIIKVKIAEIKELMQPKD